MVIAELNSGLMHFIIIALTAIARCEAIGWLTPFPKALSPNALASIRKKDTFFYYQLRSLQNFPRCFQRVNKWLKLSKVILNTTGNLHIVSIYGG